MLVRDLMQRDPTTLAVHDALDVADDIMRLGRVRHLPVVDQGRLVGVLTQRDLLRASISSLLQLRYAAEREWLTKVEVRSVMSTTLHTVSPTSTVRHAVELMIAHKIGCLPVVTDGALVGLLTETDLLQLLANQLATAEAKDRLPEFPPD
ncbi:MAG: CBS domain-containing protein [Candidatus Binatia bacterium]